MFTTKEGTALSTFEQYIRTLPDKGEGTKIVFPYITWQTYATNLTAAQAEDVVKQTFVNYVGPVQGYDIGSYGAIPGVFRNEKRSNRDNLQERANSAPQLRPISQRRNATLDNYLFDPLLGLGQTIYILDQGFNLNHEDLASTNDRQVSTYLFPNEITLGPTTPDRSLWAPDNMTEYNDHGTLVASMAGGLTYRVAPGANFVLVKFRQAAKNPFGSSGRYLYRQVTNLAIQNAWSWAIYDAMSKRRNGNTGKFIINMSFGE